MGVLKLLGPLENSFYSLQTVANPAPTVYHWQFVSDVAVAGDRGGGGGGGGPREVEEVEEEKLRWRVEGEEDYGKMICWGENSSDGRPEPCTFLITPAVR